LRRVYVEGLFGADPPKVYMDIFITRLEGTQRFLET